MNSIADFDLRHKQQGPKVSVVIPAYQSVNYISQALDSVFRQTLTDFEVIVVNDGAPETDSLEHILESYRSRIFYIRQENRGPSGARNTGILHAKGKYVAFLDSDDYWLPHHLENQIALLDNDPSLSLVYADCILLKDGAPCGTIFSVQPQSRPVTLEGLVEWRCTPGTSSVVAMRGALVAAGLFDETIRRSEDFDLWIRMALLGFRMDYQTALQVCHRKCNGLSANRLLMSESCREVYEKFGKDPRLPAHTRAIVERMTARIRLDYQIERSKVSLLSEDYADALAAAQMARGLFDNWKLHTTVTGLRVAPKLLRHGYQLYDRFLDFRSRRRNAARVKALAVAALANNLAPEEALMQTQTSFPKWPEQPANNSKVGAMAYD